MKRQTAGVENKRAELGDEMNPTEASQRARRFLHLYQHAIVRRLEGQSDTNAISRTRTEGYKKNLVAAKHLSISVSNKTRSSIKLWAPAARYVSNADQNHRFSSPLSQQGGSARASKAQAKETSTTASLWRYPPHFTRLYRSACGVWGERRTTWLSLPCFFQPHNSKTTASSLFLRHWAQTQTRGAGPNRPPPQQGPAS